MASVPHPLEPRASTPALPSASKLLRPFGRAFNRSWVIVICLALWELVPRTRLVEPAFLPPFSEVLAAGFTLLKTGELWQHVRASLSRSLLGFSLSILSAVPLGLLMGWYKGVASTLDPLLEALRNTAALALLPVFILLLGIGETSKIALIVYACSWPLLLNTVSGVRNVDPLLVKSARTMGLSSLQLFRKVILPASVPTIFVGIRLAGATSLVVLVAAEMIGAKAGLGYLIIYAQYNFQIPQMYFGILTITVIGVVFNALLQRVERHFTSWKPSPSE
jgi:NitT/TauT family transport system permease protein